MIETIDYCRNCDAPLLFTSPLDDDKLVCSNCGLLRYGKDKVVKWENKVAGFLSRGIAPKLNRGRA